MLRLGLECALTLLRGPWGAPVGGVEAQVGFGGFGAYPQHIFVTFLVIHFEEIRENIYQ